MVWFFIILIVVGIGTIGIFAYKKFAMSDHLDQAERFETLEVQELDMKVVKKWFDENAALCKGNPNCLKLVINSKDKMFHALALDHEQNPGNLIVQAFYDTETDGIYKLRLIRFKNLGSEIMSSLAENGRFTVGDN